MEGRKEERMDVMDRRETIGGRTNGWMNERKINTSDTMERLKGLKRSTRRCMNGSMWSMN